MPELTVETVTSADAFERLAPQYERILEVSDHGLPFGLHEWQSAWWMNFHKTSVFMDDRLCVKLARRGEDCVGILPLVVTSRPRGGPMRARSVTMLGADPYLTEIKVPLVDPAYAPEVARAFAADMRERERWDWVHWTGLRPDDPFAQAFVGAAGLDTRSLPPVENFVVDLPRTWDTFRKGLKRNIRESLRHCYNSLKRDGHDFTMEVVTTPAAVRACLPTFHALHGARADVEDTIQHPNRFESPISRRFLADVCDRLARKDRVRVFVMKVGDAAVAIRIGFLVGTCLYLYYSGFDPAWRKYSVMTTCVAEAMRWAIEHGLRTVNLSAGRDVSKTRWGGREISYMDAVQVRDRLRSRLLYAGHQELLKLKDDPRLGALVWRLLPRRAYW